MKKSITFIHTPCTRYDQNYGTLFMPVWAYTLASYVPSEWEKEVVDTTFDRINDVLPSDVFAFSGINQDLENILSTLNRLKARFPESTYICGGPIIL